MRSKNLYTQYLSLDALFGTPPPKRLNRGSPVIITQRTDATEVNTCVYDYTATEAGRYEVDKVEETFQFKTNGHISWINIDGLRKTDVDAICNQFGIHPLIAEDILSVNQRSKMDEVDGILYCLLNMLYFNELTGCVEQEQISIVLGKEFVISFQEDVKRDVFNPIRDKLNIHNSKLRQRGADYLCYTMLDMIVDNYLLVIDKLGERIEWLEDLVAKLSNTRTQVRINQVRKELNVLKRNIGPVRELVNGIIRSETDLLEDRTTKYFKDVYDHIIQSLDLTENYRDMMMSMQDLHLNNVNLKMNQVMKVMAIVTCLMAPATVIGGIFGMNFDRIPYLHNRYGFFLAVALMILIPLWMLVRFKRSGWFQ